MQRNTLTGFTYQYFSWIGNIFARLFYSNKKFKLEETLEVAGLKMYPDAYFSLIGFIFIVVLIAFIPIIILTGLFPLLLAPLLVIPLGSLIPKIMATDRAAKLDIEVPFAGAYISVMATGGLSPYDSLKKLSHSELMPNLAKAVRDIEVEVEIKGLDPVTAMEKSAQNMPSKDYKNLLLGYASTLRTGGDVIHYLSNRTETMFNDLAVKVRAFGDRAAALMESYIAMSILVTLSLTIIYMVSIAFSSYLSGGFTPETFMLYSYFLVPIMSIAFIYLADSQQIHEPVSEWGPYKVFVCNLTNFDTSGSSNVRSFRSSRTKLALCSTIRKLHRLATNSHGPRTRLRSSSRDGNGTLNRHDTGGYRAQLLCQKGQRRRT